MYTTRRIRSDNTDCDDNDNDIYPSSVELCNGEDDDCDGEIDEEVLQTYYIDEDGDGYGHPNEEVQTEACTIPSGFSEFSTDCDDTTDTKFPVVMKKYVMTSIMIAMKKLMKVFC